MVSVLMLLIILLILGFIIYMSYLLAYAMFSGAPYAPVGTMRLQDMLELLKVKKGEKIADLGSGDGRIVIALAKNGATAVGYEIIPPLILLSRKKIKDEKVKQAKIYNKSFWHADLSQYDALTIYCTTLTLRRLEKKILKEMKPGTRIVTNHYRFPNLKIAESKNDAYLYII